MWMDDPQKPWRIAELVNNDGTVTGMATFLKAEEARHRIDDINCPCGPTVSPLADVPGVLGDLIEHKELR
jgi:hypothetical protein